MYYLHKVKVLLNDKSYENEFLKLGMNLQQAGIVMEIVDKDAANNDTADNDAAQDGMLWITDNGETARQLLVKNSPVLFFLQDGNRKEILPGLKFAMEKPQEVDVDYLEGVYRRLRRLPWDILETDRCLLRETTEKDVDSFYEIYQEESITRYMEDLYPEIEQEKQYVREYIDKIYTFYDFGVWTVLEKASGNIIGRAGLSYREGFENPELGFVIGAPWQGKGFATEICKAILQYGREQLGFKTINALVRPENEISLKLCRNLGFTYREQIQLENITYDWLENKK